MGLIDDWNCLCLYSNNNLCSFDFKEERYDF